MNDAETIDDDEFISDQPVKRSIRFILPEIETAIGRSLDSDELQRFSSSRFAKIEYDLGKPLNDLQQSNLLSGDKLTIESLINRKLSPEETGSISLSNRYSIRRNSFFRSSSC